MARHAGFAIAATIAEAYLNQTLWAAIADQEPISLSRLFQIPTSVPLAGGGSGRLSGVGLFESRPTLHFRANPANTIGVTVTAIIFVAFNSNVFAPIDQDQTWKLRISADTDVLADADLAPNGIFLRWQPGGSTINNVTMTVLEGPGIPQDVVNAINSPSTHAAMTSALRMFGPIRITDRIFPRTLEHVQSGDFEETGFSVFEWFRIRETISRVAIRVLDGVLSVGVDLAGLSAGDPNALLDLRKHVGDGAIYHAPSFVGSRPVLRPSSDKQDSGDIDVLVNADVLGAIVAKVSAQIANTPIHPQASLIAISLRPQFFEKPLRGREIGLCFEFTVHNQIAGNVSGRIFLQPYLLTGSSDTSSSFQEKWMLYVGETQIDVPWWVDVAVAIVGTALAAAFPIAAPLFAVAAVAAIDGIIPGAVGNVGTAASAALDKGTVLALGYHDGTLPTRLQQPTDTGTTRIKVNSDGIDVHMVTVAPSLRFGEGDGTLNTARLAAELEGGRPDPYAFSLTLRNDLAVLAGDCTVQLIVSRVDTGAEVARSEGPYLASRTLTLDHLTPDLYLVDAYNVQARIFLNRVNLTGLLFASSATLKVEDALDRRHPFVTWEDHVAHFKSPLDPTKFWHRTARHTLHRTAVSARCLGLRQRIDRPKGPGGIAVDYVDELAFPFSEMQAHRSEVCDFCFFGRPNGTTVFPQDDWFKKP
jgi:hypothetical protein